MHKTGRFSTLFVFTMMLGLLLPSVAGAQGGRGGIDDNATTKLLKDALVSEAVLIVYGTGSDDATTEGLKKFSEELKADLEKKMGTDGWPITIRADGEVSLPELGGCFLFLVGTTHSNIILTLNQSVFPLGLDDTGVTVGKERIEGSDVAVTFAMINPFNQSHYAVVYSGVTDVAIWNAPEYAYEEIGYVVVNNSGVQLRGQFDTTIPEYWTLLPGASVKQVSQQLTESATAMGIDFKPENPLPHAADKSVYMLGYNPNAASVEIQQFLFPYLSHLHQQHDVRLVALEAPLWMSAYLDTYVVDGKAPPEDLQLPEDTVAFIEELRAYNKGLSSTKRIHLATFDLNHDVFSRGNASSLLPIKTAIGQLKDRETRKELSEVLSNVSEAYEGGTPAAMLQAVNRLNEAVSVAALKKKVPAEIYPKLRAYLDTEKTSIFFHQPENQSRLQSSSLQEARAKILRQNMTDLIKRADADLEAPVLFFLHADHCNKGAPGRSYGRIPMAQYFDKYYEPTWEKVHSTVVVSHSGGYWDPKLMSTEVVDGGYTPDEFESLVADFRKPNSLVFVDLSAPFWLENRVTINHIWTWPGELYDDMVFFFDVKPMSGQMVAPGK